MLLQPCIKLSKARGGTASFQPRHYKEVKDRKATEESLALERAHIRDYLHFWKSLNFTTENGNIIRTEKEGLKPTLQQGEGKTQGLERNLEIERELLEIGGLVASRLGDSSSDGGEESRGGKRVRYWKPKWGSWAFEWLDFILFRLSRFL